MYKYINPLDRTYQKVTVILRVPEKFYAQFNRIFGNRLGTFQPFRWLLHKNIKVNHE